MAVHLKKKAVRPEPPPLPASMERALLAVLMYFPHQKCRALASDIMAGNVPFTVDNIRKIIKAIKSYGDERLAVDDPGLHVFHAWGTFRAFTGEAKPSRAPVRKRRVIGRMAKCR